jgi:hypothetical protein
VSSKRYYWIKLKETLMSSDAVDFLMSQKSGANYVVLYQMICLKTVNTAGLLARQIGEVIIPYDAEKIQRDCKYFDIDTVRVALELYKKLGLIYIQEDGLLRVADFENLIGNETKWAEYKRKARLDESKKKSIGQCPTNVQQDIDIRDRDRDIERDNIYIYNNSTSAVLEPSTTPTADIFITLPLISKKNYAIYKQDVETWQKLYPACDVKQELRKMAGWLDANPANRKTERGIKRFVVNWLSREQDRAKAEKPIRPKGKVKTDEYSQEQLGSVFYTGD